MSGDSQPAPRIILRHDVSYGCFAGRHLVTGRITTTYTVIGGRSKMHMVRFDEPVPRDIWGTQHGLSGLDECVVLRSRWKGFEVGDRWPTSVDVLVVRKAADADRGRARRKLIGLAKCLCFSEATSAKYASTLFGNWHGCPPPNHPLPWWMRLTTQDEAQRPDGPRGSEER